MLCTYHINEWNQSVSAVVWSSELWNILAGKQSDRSNLWGYASRERWQHARAAARQSIPGQDKH